ncbi:MAG: hypothetical protein P2976_09050 [Gemmatimonadota bacterium]|nr:hypothetical protein [Gemmatimonadota bacterium]
MTAPLRYVGVLGLLSVLLAMPCRLAAGDPAARAGALGMLLGPLTPIRAADAYDTTMLARGAAFADVQGAKPDKDLNGDGKVDVGDHLFYDLPLVLYKLHYRSGDPAWRERARAAAVAWREYPGNRKIVPYLAGAWKLWPELVNQPRCMGTMGLAVLALEADDAEARKLVDAHARLIESAWMHGTYQSLGDPVMPFGDPRESGYGLIALVASTVLGDNHRPAAKELLDRILERQQADGQWLAKDAKAPGGGCTSNFMTGILTEALVLYDRAIGDPRILPAVERNLAWTWKTQWVAAERGFQYHAVGETRPDGLLGGLMVQAWGFAYARTGNRAYLDQGHEIMRGLTGRGLGEIWGVKQYAQAFRSSPNFLGYIERQ